MVFLFRLILGSVVSHLVTVVAFDVFLLPVLVLVLVFRAFSLGVGTVMVTGGSRFVVVTASRRLASSASSATVIVRGAPLPGLIGRVGFSPALGMLQACGKRQHLISICGDRSCADDGKLQIRVYPRHEVGGPLFLIDRR